MMKPDKEIQEDILKHAEKLLYYSDLLIEQCESWLPAEEGNKQMMEKMRRRKQLKIKN